MNLLPSLSFMENNVFKISIRKFARLKFKIDDEELKLKFGGNSWVSSVPVCVDRFSRTFLDQSTSKDFLYFSYHSNDLFFEGSSALFEIGVLPTTLQPLVKKVHYIHIRGLLQKDLIIFINALSI